MTKIGKTVYNQMQVKFAVFPRGEE